MKDESKFMSTKQRKLFGLAAILAVFVALLVGQTGTKEPSYHGRRLSSWLSDFESDQPGGRMAAAIAVKQIGSNSVPLLVAYLDHPRRRSENEFVLIRWSRRFLEWAHITAPVPTRPHDLRLQGLAGLDALGPEAKDALPALEKLLHETPPDPRALYVVARIGDRGVPLLTRSLTNSNSEAKLLRLEARCCLDMMTSHSPLLYPVEPDPNDAGFNRRICEFNLKVLSAAFREYRAEHPEQFDPPAVAPAK